MIKTTDFNGSIARIITKSGKTVFIAVTNNAIEVLSQPSNVQVTKSIGQNGNTIIKIT